MNHTIKNGSKFANMELQIAFYKAILKTYDYTKLSGYMLDNYW